MTDAAGAARPRALLIAPHLSYRTAAYQAAAGRLGIELVLASTSEVTTTHGAGIHIDDGDTGASAAALLEALAERPVAGVLASDDAMVELASTVAERLQLPCNPPSAARFSRRKDLARARLRASGVRVPAHAVLALDDDASAAAAAAAVGWPAVIKPLAWSGSRGVMRVDDAAGYAGARAHLARLLAAEPPADPYERRHALLESFVAGPEVAVEALLTDGTLVPLALFDKPDPLDGPYFEETYYVTPSRHPRPVREAVFAMVGDVCRAYGLRHGPVHAELRVGADGPWPIEVAARTIGGDCARLLRFGAGHGLEELVLANAVGRVLDSSAAAGSAGVLMLPIAESGVLRRVEGVLAAADVPGIEDVVISRRAGEELVAPPDGASYLGFLFARGPDAAAVETALRRAHAELRVVVAPKLPLEVASI